MKKKICMIGLVIFTLFLCACSKEEIENEIMAIDFSDYTVYEVIEWANENDIASLLSFVYSSDGEEVLETILAQSIEEGSPIIDSLELIVYSAEFPDSNVTSKTLVPNVIGKSLDDAKADLTALGLSVDTKYESSEKEKDTVLLSDPLPGISVSEGEKVLLTLSSGETKKGTLSVTLEINSTSNEDNIIKVYVDGELDRSKTVCLDSSVTSKTFHFTGSGTKEVRFTINGEEAAVYSLDFTNGEIFEIG